MILTLKQGKVAPVKKKERILVNIHQHTKHRLSDQEDSNGTRFTEHRVIIFI